MKKLLLIRHAKSDWEISGIKDFERPLNSRGRKNAPEMGKRLSEKRIIPDVIVTSPAVRALSTCEIITRELGLAEKVIKLEPNIYEASVKTLLNIVNNFDNDKDFVALFGHNNGLTDLAAYLTGADIFNIPTCGLVLIEFPFLNWNMISKETGEVLLFDYPKNQD